MHFARTEEQDTLAVVVRSLLDKRSDSAAVRAAVGSESGYDESLWQALCEQVGVAALPIAEEHDGFGASFIETSLVLEELGRTLAPSPLLATAIATAAVLLHAEPEHQATLLPRIATGEIATLALDPLVLDAPAADIVLRLQDGALQLLTGPAIEPVGALDQSIRFGRVTANEAQAVGEVPDDRPVRDVAAALTSALQVGAAQRGLDMTVAYTLERVQFGRPIGSFQALKHRMADMLVLVEASRSASWGATAAAAAYVTEPTVSNAAILRRRAAVARSYCSDALDHVASETVQLHGGIAITWEHDSQLVFKRAHALSHLWEPAHVARASLLPFDEGGGRPVHGSTVARRV
ncbi:MAG: acyl-CoA dehydrogenase [Marmoricola sp.]|nr:acyl-CoA dehydrogenase [Marmoricola sp.]